MQLWRVATSNRMKLEPQEDRLPRMVGQENQAQARSLGVLGDLSIKGDHTRDETSLRNDGGYGHV